MAKQDFVHTAKVNAVEGAIRGLISKNSQITPQQFFIGLHNAFAHGDILNDADFSVTDEQLSAMFDHFDALSKISENID